MHRLAESFPSYPQNAYPCWDSEPCIGDPERSFHPSQAKIIGAIRDVKEKISRLEKPEHGFGLIHDDLHSRNVFETNGEIAIIDFECLHRSWFLADIASALLFRVWIGPQKNEAETLTMAKQFLVNLLSGYLEEHDLVNDWRAQRPLFLRLREIRLYGSMFAGQSFSGSSEDSLFHYVFRSISEDRPFLNIDFDDVAA
jgi:Ser/Thr protein kinase RdoA (MazF antagonist)